MKYFKKGLMCHLYMYLYMHSKEAKNQPNAASLTEVVRPELTD